jgi:hypothetical protein
MVEAGFGDDGVDDEGEDATSAIVVSAVVLASSKKIDGFADRRTFCVIDDSIPTS